MECDSRTARNSENFPVRQPPVSVRKNVSLPHAAAAVQGSSGDEGGLEGEDPIRKGVFPLQGLSHPSKKSTPRDKKLSLRGVDDFRTVPPGAFTHFLRFSEASGTLPDCAGTSQHTVPLWRHNGSAEHISPG